MTDLEARMTALEAQVADLMKDKAKQKKKALALFLQSEFIKNAGDAFAVLDDSEFASKGMYCRHCIENDDLFTLLPLEWDEIPSIDSSPRTSQCPFCDRLLRLQWENR